MVSRTYVVLVFIHFLYMLYALFQEGLNEARKNVIGIGKHFRPGIIVQLSLVNALPSFAENFPLLPTFMLLFFNPWPTSLSTSIVSKQQVIVEGIFESKSRFFGFVFLPEPKKLLVNLCKFCTCTNSYNTTFHWRQFLKSKS